MNSLKPIFIIAFIVALFLHKYLKLNQYPIVRKITIVLIIVTSIGSILLIFTNINLSGKDYGWHVAYMDYKSMHEYSTGKSQRLAIIDSGISDFLVENNNNKENIVLVGDNKDNNGHGTMMYSIIKGYEDEVLGIAPDVEIVSIKVINSDEKIEPSIIAKAIQEAIKQEVTIINISIGSHKFNHEISDIIDDALNKGITIISSSGDYFQPDMMFPANKNGVISVGSLSANKKVSDFTNAPKDTIINAPGDEIKSINQFKDIEFNSGTSQSAAIISGYVSLLKDYAYQNNINLSNEEIQILLKDINDMNIKYVDAFSEIK